MTNGEKIRQMSDEELANTLFFKERMGHFCNKALCEKHGAGVRDTCCEECLLDWLKQEVE